MIPLWIGLYLLIGTALSLYAINKAVEKYHLSVTPNQKILCAIGGAPFWPLAILLGVAIAARNWWRYRFFPRSVNDPPYKKNWLDDLIG